MNQPMLVAIISFFGTLIGSLGGIIASARLTTYRIQRLEEEVKNHNNFAKRLPVVEEQIKEIDKRITKLEGN